MLDKVLSFKPVVRFACKTTNKKDYDDFLFAYDYRIFFITDGKVRAVFNDGQVDLSIGDILLIPPKIGYKLQYFGKIAHYYILNFDITDGKLGIDETPPVPYKDFCDKFVISTIPQEFSSYRVYQNNLGLTDIFAKINQEFNLPINGNVQVASLFLKIVLIKLSQNKYIEIADSLPEVLAKSYIDQNYFSNIDNEQIAKKLGYHPYYLGTVFKKRYGITMHDYVINCKLNSAKELLLQTTKSISEIAYQVGFSSPSYFSEIFKLKCGVKPTDYRKKAR
jgi:AraC-like DNA-binding protein